MASPWAASSHCTRCASCRFLLHLFPGGFASCCRFCCSGATRQWHGNLQDGFYCSRGPVQMCEHTSGCRWHAQPCEQPDRSHILPLSPSGLQVLRASVPWRGLVLTSALVDVEWTTTLRQVHFASPAAGDHKVRLKVVLTSALVDVEWTATLRRVQPRIHTRLMWHCGLLTCPVCWLRTPVTMYHMSLRKWSMCSMWGSGATECHLGNAPSRRSTLLYAPPATLFGNCSSTKHAGCGPG